MHRSPKYLLIVCMALMQCTSELTAQQAHQQAVKHVNDDLVFHALSAAEYQQTFDELVPKGYIPISIDVKVEGDIAYYELVMQKKNDSSVISARHLLTDQEFAKTNQELLASGFELLVHKPYRLGSINRHIGLWKRSKPKPLGELWKDANSVPVSGEANSTTLPLDQLMQTILAKHQAVGATLAVSYQGKLIYSRGFGYSDLENRVLTEPNTRMRIASVSKPITAAAILQLIDQGKLSFKDKVFEKLPFRPITKDNADIDTRLADITIEHLLLHTAGWNRDVSGDPMFPRVEIAKHLGKSLPLEPADIIQYMLSQPLDDEPGTHYAYSNFGYSVLGRVIEQVSGVDYATYVKDNILSPLDIRSMEIGKTKIGERAINETLYYTQSMQLVPSIMEPGKLVIEPYGKWCLETLDSHGGWIASASDLVKFAKAFDDPEQCPLMSSQAVSSMFVPPSIQAIESSEKAQRFYGCGWSIAMYPDGKRFNAFHSGLIPGSSSMLVRRIDGFCWAVLFNTDRSADEKVLASEFDALIHQAIDAVKKSH